MRSMMIKFFALAGAAAAAYAALRFGAVLAPDAVTVTGFNPMGGLVALPAAMGGGIVGALIAGILCPWRG